MQNKIKKDLEHIPVLERGTEYDEEGRIGGEWCQEVCARCGAELGFMNSSITCSEGNK